MGRNAAFARPGTSDRLQAWWDATSRTSKTNLALFFVVGSVSLGLVLAALSRDAGRTPGLATASRPRVNVPVSVPEVPTAPDLRPAGLGAAPTPLGDQGSASTTRTTLGTVAPSSPVAASRPSAASPSPATTVPDPGIVFTEVPTPQPAPEPTSPSSTLARTVTTTTPPVSAPPTSAPPPSNPAPTSTAPPTTAAALLPALPPVVSGPRS